MTPSGLSVGLVPPTPVAGKVPAAKKNFQRFSNSLAELREREEKKVKERGGKREEAGRGRNGDR